MTQLRVIESQILSHGTSWSLSHFAPLQSKLLTLTHSIETLLMIPSERDARATSNGQQHFCSEVPRFAVLYD